MHANQTKRLTLVSGAEKRGRPKGSTKDGVARLRDYVRTVATMQEVMSRATNTNNANQFARWFDEGMRERHPRLLWQTERTNKWRRNIDGDVAFLQESVDHLNELFPDGRYYVVIESQRRARKSEVGSVDSSATVTTGAVREQPLSAREFFEEGPGRLWSAIWSDEASSSELWDLYPSTEMFAGFWGGSCEFGRVVENLETKLYSSVDCGESIEFSDLGRAIVLHRLQGLGHGVPGDGVDTYLCVRLALAELSPALKFLNIYDELATYIVGLEHRRQEEDVDYRGELVSRHVGDASFDRRDYAENPFLFLRADAPTSARRYDSLASLSAYSVKFV